jgi:hypothetical protein
LILKKLSSKVLFSLGSGTGSGSGLSKNAGSGSVLNQSGSTTLILKEESTLMDIFE